MIQDVAATLTLQIEVSVLGEVHRRGLIRARFVFDLPFISIGEPVGDADLQIARIAFIAMRAEMAEAHTLRVITAQAFRLPHRFVEALQAAMKRAGNACRMVVGGECVSLPVQCEAGMGDTVGIAPGHSAMKRRVAQIILQRVVAQHHVRHPARTIRSFQAQHDGAVSHRAQSESMTVG